MQRRDNAAVACLTGAKRDPHTGMTAEVVTSSRCSIDTSV
jgi:hypothetical protein